ncbi:MAG: amino acid decarboxylase [Bryobacterales bacterium]|nr:amino acid decarboxylase [Bryobacterales bacterium]
MRPNDMPPEEFRRFSTQVIDWVEDYLDEMSDLPVFPQVKPGDVVDALPDAAPVHGEPMEDILDDFKEIIVPALNHWNHPRFNAYFSVSASKPGILAEILASAINTNGMLWKSCPGHVELEQVVMSWLRQWLGLPEAFFGEILDTASTSTLQAIAAARVSAAPETRLKGAPRDLIVYTSEQAHSSVEKGAMSLGMGLEQVRKIAADAAFRMIPAKLAKAIQHDRAAGLRPCCIVSTVGTTAVTAIDPVAEIQAIAESEGLWHHVDAAYGGAAAILPEMRWMLQGAERADSLVFNPHKWLFTPIDCSAFFCRRPGALREAFSLVPPYLRTEKDSRAVNYMDYGIALGRRFRALKLWFVMRYFGREGVSTIIRRHNLWARQLAGLISEDSRFELSAPVTLSLVCLRYKGTDEDNQRIVDRVNESGTAFLGGSVINGRYILRIAIGNIATTHDDVLRVWDAVRKAV